MRVVRITEEQLRSIMEDWDFETEDVDGIRNVADKVSTEPFTYSASGEGKPTTNADITVTPNYPYMSGYYGGIRQTANKKQ